ncbi:uncharacterized protein BXZ73DRAFT_83319 [Epithele typhae]|uniref:uncharacterized protein n=1 Tax=Epithele typhae TaxID=378194 RepID=UPI002008E48F|nr:uncharacterized protein BXZ73DRAFT_83319 [Epithele typhae]KAH9910669.1 hypothetical protein BXZ73DRAFT_83319 [Epithele typhae]
MWEMLPPLLSFLIDHPTFTSVLDFARSLSQRGVPFHSYSPSLYELDVSLTYAQTGFPTLIHCAPKASAVRTFKHASRVSGLQGSWCKFSKSDMLESLSKEPRANMKAGAKHADPLRRVPQDAIDLLCRRPAPTGTGTWLDDREALTDSDAAVVIDALPGSDTSARVKARDLAGAPASLHTAKEPSPGQHDEDAGSLHVTSSLPCCRQIIGRHAHALSAWIVLDEAPEARLGLSLSIALVTVGSKTNWFSPPVHGDNGSHEQKKDLGMPHESMSTDNYLPRARRITQRDLGTPTPASRATQPSRAKDSRRPRKRLDADPHFRNPLPSFVRLRATNTCRKRPLLGSVDALKLEEGAKGNLEDYPAEPPTSPYPTPLLIAHIGYQGVVHEDAECAPARGPGALDIPLIRGSAVSRSRSSKSQGERPCVVT